MTNNELIQALKLCLTRTDCCFGCAMLNNKALDIDGCQRALAENIIELINNQAMEIEDLQNTVRVRTETTNAIKIEAVEEFIMMLEGRLVQMCRDEDAYIPYPFTFIDELLKEYSESLKEDDEV